MTRITLEMSAQDTLVAMAEGSPGAISVMIKMIESAPRIDPDNVLGGMGPVLFLDTLGIYGSRIWMLHKDVCGESVEDTLAVLRAVQMGLARQIDLDPAIDGMATFDVAAAKAAVQEALPNFATATEVAE